MAQLWCTGPAHLYVGLGGSKTGKTPLYLGTAETKPDIDIKGEVEGVMNDVAGSKLPMDELWEGEEAMISFVLTRWNMPVVLSLMSQPDPFGGAGGVNAQDDVGTLFLTENYSFPFWVRFPYAASKGAMAGMVFGYRFWACKILSPKKIEPGTRAMKHHFIVHAKRTYTNATSPAGTGMLSGGPNAVFRLYDHNMTGLPAID